MNSKSKAYLRTLPALMEGSATEMTGGPRGRLTQNPIGNGKGLTR